MDLISCNAATVRYGDFTALSQFNLSVAANQCAVLIGPNGAGKSTCLKLLAGLENSSAGHVQILGQNPATASRPWRKQLGVLPEHLGLLEALTIDEHLLLTARVHGLSAAEARQRANDLLEVLGLANSPHTFASAASYGMRKKTALAMAILPAPRVLILDEPFEGLDPASCETVLALLLHILAQGRAIVASSHMLMHVERLATETVLLDHGQVSWRGTTTSEGELRRHYLDVITAATLPALDWLG